MSTYKTNWQLTETVMPEDMNRIEENTKENNNALSEFKKQYNVDSKEENKKIDRKAEKEDVILKVTYPEDRDCNSFKQANAFFYFDTGTGEFKNTPEGTIPHMSGRVFIVKNTGERGFQQEFINIYPTNRVTRYVRNYTFGNDSWSKWYKVYDEANKPTPKDIGAYPVPKSRVADFNTMLTEGQYLITSECSNAPVTGVRYGILLVYVSSGDTHNNSNNWVWQEYYDTNGNRYWRYKVNDMEWFPWRKDYNSGEKPTPHDIGAISQTPTRVSSINNITKPGFYVVDSSEGPTRYGRLLVLGWDNSQKWVTQVFFSDTTNKIYSRCITSLDGLKWSGWSQIYSTEYKPTPQDIGALPTTGGELSGHLIMSPGQKFVGAHNYGYSCRTKEGSDDYVIYIDADNKVHVGYSGRPVKIDSLDIVNKNNKKIYHEDNKPTPEDIGASNRRLVLDTGSSFIVGGEADKYYPVIIQSLELHGIYGLNKISISRAYNTQAPDSWNNATHRGGLTLTLLTTGDCYWGGNDMYVEVLRFSQSYSKMVAGMNLSTQGIVVWLRGGGAKYYLTSDYGEANRAKVMLEGFTDSANQVFNPRDNDNNVGSEILNLYRLRESGLYDKGERVYSPNNKPSLSALGAAASNHNHDSVYLGKTATAANSNKLANMGLYDSSKGTQGIPNVGNDGVMEVGRMIDFHEPGTNKDFNTRLESINGALKCWQDFSAPNLWAQKYMRINDWYGGPEDGRLWYKQEGRILATENVQDFQVANRSVAKGDYWDNGDSTRVFHLGGGVRLVRQWIGTNASNSAGGVNYTIHFPKAWSWVIPISLVSDNMANTNSYTSGYCTIDALSNVHLNGGCYQMTPGKSTRIHLTYLAGE